MRTLLRPSTSSSSRQTRRLARIEVDKGIQGLADHGTGQVGHALKIGRDGNQRATVQGQGPLGDVLRQVAHALQVGVDQHGGGDAPQIDGHRLVQSQNLETLLLDQVFLSVDFVVSVDHLLGQRRVVLLQRRGSPCGSLPPRKRPGPEGLSGGCPDRVPDVSTSRALHTLACTARGSEQVRGLDLNGRPSAQRRGQDFVPAVEFLLPTGSWKERRKSNTCSILGWRRTLFTLTLGKSLTVN